MTFITKVKIECSILRDLISQIKLRGLIKAIRYSLVCSKLLWLGNRASYIQKHKMNLDFLSTHFHLSEDIPASQPILSSAYKIWVLWWQGKEEMPEIVRATYNSIVRNSGKEVILITRDNYRQYIDIPDYIESKVAHGKMKLPALSDFIRCSLLDKYGGMWIDSTILMASQPPSEIFDKQLFTIRSGINTKPLAGKYVAAGRWNVQILGTNRIHHPLFYQMRYLWMEYWSKYDSLIDYLLVDYTIARLYDMDLNIRHQIDHIECSNPDMHGLLPLLGKPYDDKKRKELEEDTYLFKLTYKLKGICDTSKKNTFYNKILEEWM